MANCPRFWRDRTNPRIEIRLLNLTEANYMDAIPTQTPYIIIAISYSIGIFNFLYVWHSSNLKEVYKQTKEGDRVVRKYSFLLTGIIGPFILPMIDTVLGKCILLIFKLIIQLSNA